MKGIIIAIEGTDCSGKETQAKLLVENLMKENIKAVYMGFPDYDSPTGKIVGGPYLGKKEISESWFLEGVGNVEGKIASLYYAADRAYHLKTIKKYVEEGYVLVLDRYVESNMAFQGGKIKDECQRDAMYEWIEKLEYGLLELPRPDMILFLYMPAYYASILKKNRISLDEHEKNKEILLQAEKAYLELAKKYHYDQINCVKDEQIRPISDIANEVYEKVVRKLQK